MKICIFILGAGLLLSACHSQKKLARNRASFVASQPVVMAMQETVSDTLMVEEEAVPPTVRTEKVEMTEGHELMRYCIIVGSFRIEQNAQNLRKSLIRQGFLGSSIMRNPEGMYRVSADCAEGHAEAWQQLLSIRSQNPGFRDAWLLQTTE